MQPDGQAGNDTLPDLGVNPGYALGRLAKALRTSETHADPATRERAERKVASWVAVYEGLLSGALRVGSRTPVADTPTWATLEVAHGGFATGSLLADGPLLPHERERLARLPAAPDGAERGTLNTSYLTDEGLAELGELLDSGRYRLNIPEEGALLTVAWLIREGNTDAARTVLDAIGPFLDRLRFYPVPDPTPLTGGAVVFLQDVGTTAAQLAALRPRPAVLAQREAIAVWVPLFDRLVGLFLETVEGEVPSLRRGTDGMLEKTADGRFVVEGGWPCQLYPDGWRDRARALLSDYARLRAEHQLCGKPEKAKRNFARLRGFLESCITDARKLTGRDVGLIRLILAGVVGRHGQPGSTAGEARRQMQAAQAAAPTPAEVARVLGERLAKFPRDGGLDSLDTVAGPVSPEEASRHRVPAGRALPASLHTKLRRSLAAEVPALVEAGVIPSAEVLAKVIPQITAQVRSAGIEDPALRRLYQALYGAFRRRRSLLLLNLESQVKLAELPWVAAIDSYRRSGLSARERARQTLEQVVGLAVTAFPQQILPNKLLQEVRALAEEAGLKLPIVDEVAADIFMGDFSEKFLRAAQTAAEVLGGSLYERYYGLLHPRPPVDRPTPHRPLGHPEHNRILHDVQDHLRGKLACRAQRHGGLQRDRANSNPQPPPGGLCHLLLPDDLDLAAGVLRVRNKPAVGWQVKTRAERDVPLLPELVKLLTAQLGGRASGPVFVRRKWLTGEERSARDLEIDLARRVADREAATGQPIDRAARLRLATATWRAAGAVREDRVRVEYLRVTRTAGLSNSATPKTLRHQFATALQEGRVDPLVRNLLMGHAAAGERTAGHGLGMTAVYTHTRPETIREQLFAALTGRPAVAVVRDRLTG